MKIGIYIAKNEGARANVNRAEMLAEAWGDSTVIARKPQDLKGCDAVLNQIIDHAPKIEDQRRYIGYGPQVLLFVGNVGEYRKRHYMLRDLLCLYDVPMVCHSPFHYAEVRDMLRMLAPAEQRKLCNQLHFIPGGVEDPGIGNNDKSLWMVPFNRVNYEQKKIDDHVSLGNDAKGLIAMQQSTVIDELLLIRDAEEVDKHHAVDLSNYRIEKCPTTREAYFAEARRCGMFLSTSAFESFGVMPLELLLAGQVGVFVDYPWVRQLLPDYPLVVAKAEVPATLAHVHANFDRYRQHVIDKVQPFIRSTYSQPAFAAALRNLLETRVNER